ncbi:uncharacterized protein KQ657_004119 [Scheffersomyces spartinae]|uniref:Methyltransferase type 11 domain-containing protein n=1 Tax=Scheffersomyces spartinae TaxID=45513 RepID=A0A9P7VBU5_9ASCO|nr:uncharacterized protein KQ657_004119 [Scheffersomyces spartinae]KAG7195007.1 hypothetical protein KQ657_004119 [Scheffersomyces spartinae]
MAQFSDSSYNTKLYASYRPEYPQSFYKILTEALEPKNIPVNRVIDLGCGTGVATYPLLELGKEVIGLDLSQGMIDTANKLKQERLLKAGISDASRITFIQGRAEDFRDQPESFDLITCAECLHWFTDYESFFRETYKLLTPGGLLAYWYYIDPLIMDYTGSDKALEEENQRIFSAAKAIYCKYVYDDPKYMGPHWEQPGRSIVQNGYREIDSKIPRELFTGTTVQAFEPATAKSVPSSKDLVLEKTIGLNDFGDYLKTFSAYSAYKKATNDPDNVIELVLELLERECGWDRSTTNIKILWKTGYTFLRK